LEEIDVGSKLRFVRQRHGLSQRQLAKRAGVANATVSLIESNAINPSVGALKRIVDAIPMSLSEFFALDTVGPPKVFFRASELVEIGRGGVSYRQIGGRLSGKALQILSEHYSPGSESGKIPLQHDGEEGGLVIRGQLEVTVGTERTVLGPGDAYHFDSRTPHRFRNVGDGVCEVVTACTPPTF
jgi:transcriptional regulator with XRE-family HTH domain